MNDFLYFFFLDGYQEKLLDMMDADLLPAFLGGNRYDPDGNPLCYTYVSSAIDQIKNPIDTKLTIQKQLIKL